MAKIIGYFATSHAYAFLGPEKWDKRRDGSRANYKRFYGNLPEIRPEVALETASENQRRYSKIQQGHDHIRARLAEHRPDVILLIGDDQDENYTEQNLPQFSIFAGEEFTAADRSTGERLSVRSDPSLAQFILNEMVEGGFDLAYSTSFGEGGLRSHAHTEPLVHLVRSKEIAVLPLFVNAIHVPAPTPSRCFEFGRVLRSIIENYLADTRIMVCASGGMSHFTAGYPYRHYKGPFSFGSISVDFDRRLIESISSGDFRDLLKLSNQDLLANGDIEFRQWLVMLGALGHGTPEYLAYEPFFSGLTGMGVGYWNAQS